MSPVVVPAKESAARLDQPVCMDGRTRGGSAMTETVGRGRAQGQGQGHRLALRQEWQHQPFGEEGARLAASAPLSLPLWGSDPTVFLQLGKRLERAALCFCQQLPNWVVIRTRC